MSDQGHIDLERSLDSIVVGHRHRQDLGDIDALMRSITEIGLLQPITITPDGVLVCGRRRLEAMRRMGQRTLKVWVRSGISDRLSALLAQQDENAQREPLSMSEGAALYAELKALYSEDAARRQAATRFGGNDSAEESGAAQCSGPPRGGGEARVQAANAITGDRSYNRFERILWLERVAARTSQHSAAIRELAGNELKEIQDGAPVFPGYSRVKAAIDIDAQHVQSTDDLETLAAAALARVRQEQARQGVRALKRTKITGPKHRSLRAFILTWTELDGWSQHYDATELAESLKDDEYDLFEKVVAETISFSESLGRARASLVSA